jgi:FkbM family methyltransferase
MTGYAWMMSLLPITVNVSGRKNKLICQFGKLISGQPRNIEFNSKIISLDKHPIAQIYYYAPSNFIRDFEKSELGKLMLQNLKPNDVFVDVGANLGGYSFLAKTLGAKVIAFEPFPELYAFLSENEHCFGKTYPIALSDQLGNFTFHISDKNIGGSSLVASNKGKEQSGYTREVNVEVSKGDSILNELATIHWLKIDVEGNEAAAVRGFERLLIEKKIENIWCEVRGPESDRNANSYKEVCAFLESHHFDAFTVFRGKRIPFDFREEKKVPQYFDLLFTLKPNI